MPPPVTSRYDGIGKPSSTSPDHVAVWPGATLDASATVTEVADGRVKFDVSTKTPEGVAVLSGYAEARIDA